MPGLPKQPLFVPVGGLETEIDDKLLPLGRMLDLENAYMPRAGEAVRRFGTTALPAPSSTPYTLATHKNALVALPYADPLEVLPTITDTWAKGTALSGPIIGSMASKMSVGLTKAGATNVGLNGTGVMVGPDIATDGLHYFLAYLDSGSARTMHFSAIDITTGHVVADYQQVLVGVDFKAWRVTICNNQAVCAFLTSAGALSFIGMDTSVFTVNLINAGVVSLTAGGAGLPQFDMYLKNSTTVSVVYPFDTGGSTIVARCADFTPSPALVTPWSPKDSAGADIRCDNAVAWMMDLNFANKVALIASRPTRDVRVHWDIPAAGATRQAVTTYSYSPVAEAGTEALVVTGFTTAPTATGEFVVMYDTGTGAITDFVGILSRISGTLTNGPIVFRGATLRSKAWKCLGDYFAVVSFSSATQGTHYVVKIPIVTTLQTTAPVVAIFSVRMGKGMGFSGVATTVTNSTFAIATGYIIRVGDLNNPDTPGVQIASVKVQALPDTTIGAPKEVIDSLFVPGGMLRQFDGITYGEAGFAYGPEMTSVNVIAGAGSGLSGDSDYFYAVLYSYMDAQGRRWTSAPSVPVLVHLSAVQHQVTVAPPTLRLTGRTNVVIEIYRGARGIFDDLRKVGTVANNVAVDNAVFVDTVPDTTQAGGEPLYTSGGVIENDTHPGFIAICIAQNRMWGIPSDDPQSVWYSKEFVVGQGLGWSEDQIIDVRDERGPLRGLAVIDNKPIAWKDDALNVCLGTGPNVLGQGGSYVFEVSSRGFGSSNAMALCETKDGAMFVSTSQRAGIFLLDRSLSAQYVGAPVQRYVSDVIVAGVYYSKLNQARFYTTSGRTLVYDLINQQWSTFTSQPCYAAVSWNGVPVYVNVIASHVLYEKLNGTVYTEDGSAYTSRYGFPWLQVNQIKGYERFFRVQPVGQRMAALTGATMALYKNFDESTPLIVANFADTGTVLQQELRYSAKLGAMKLIIEDASTTAGLKISGYTAIVAAKAGLRPSSTRMT